MSFHILVFRTPQVNTSSVQTNAGQSDRETSLTKQERETLHNPSRRPRRSPIFRCFHKTNRIRCMAPWYLIEPSATSPQDTQTTQSSLCLTVLWKPVSASEMRAQVLSESQCFHSPNRPWCMAPCVAGRLELEWAAAMLDNAVLFVGCYPRIRSVNAPRAPHSHRL